MPPSNAGCVTMPLEVRLLAEWEAAGTPGLLSVVIPAHIEEGQIEETIDALVAALTAAGIAHEILVVNDNSRDATEAILQRMGAASTVLRQQPQAERLRLGRAHRPAEPAARRWPSSWPTARTRRTTWCGSGAGCRTATTASSGPASRRAAARPTIPGRS
jgi:cellulose synthase/poly-beta-1,6-N-acetylglucosamine synthase-like glycosyltransferase